ncbi:MAG: hypothetical protein AMS27_08040 [Bacteroides sp. SM23_62_1]|nr:MAG: hypothetical protein AMS27_08040 [Bacteroides sp. SM23_62_1]
MSETLFKKLVTYFGILLLIILIPLIISSIYYYEPIMILSTFLLCVAGVSEITIISIYYTENKKFRIIIYALIPFFLIIPFVLDIITGWIILPIISGSFAVTLICAALFIFNRKRTTLFLYILLIVILLGIIMARFHVPGAGITLSLGLMLFAAGIVMYSITSLSLRKNNKYLSVVIPVCSFILAIFGVGVLFKIQHWPGGWIMTYFSTISIILITIIILLTLPQSGFFNWSPDHKKLFFRNTMIPWLIAAFFIGYYFLIPPNIKEIIFPPRERIPFNMYYYEINQVDTKDADIE